MDNNSIIRYILRRRKIQRSINEDKPLESSSIGDLAFLLLIFFVVTGSFVIRQGIFFSLPSKSAAPLKIDEKLIIEVYPQSRGFKYNDILLNRQRMMETLKGHKRDNSNIILVIFMNPRVKYDRLVDTLSLAKEVGIKRISLKNLSGEG